MKDLNEFKAFALSKAQMNALAGGAIINCNVIYADGGSYTREMIQDGLTEEAAEAEVRNQAPGAEVDCYYV